MKKISAFLSLVACLAFLVPASPAAGGEEPDSVLVKELVQEKLYEAGLTLQGDSGFLITSSTDSLHPGTWIVGLSGFLDHSSADTGFRKAGFTFSASAGLWENVLGMAHDLEVSLSVPYLVDEISRDTGSGLGDARVSFKAKVVEGKPMTDVPDIALVVSAVIPSGDDAYTRLDAGGVEAGAVFGTRIADSADLSEFRLYLDIRYALYDFRGQDEQDQFVKLHVGISFPMADLQDCSFLLETGRITKNNNGLNATDYAAAVRYQSVGFNLTAGVLMSRLHDADRLMRRLYLAYDRKF